jgi:hypothetical protein
LRSTTSTAALTPTPTSAVTSTGVVPRVAPLPPGTKDSFCSFRRSSWKANESDAASDAARVHIRSQSCMSSFSLSSRSSIDDGGNSGGGADGNPSPPSHSHSRSHACSRSHPRFRCNACSCSWSTTGSSATPSACCCALVGASLFSPFVPTAAPASCNSYSELCSVCTAAATMIQAALRARCSPILASESWWVVENCGCANSAD